MIKHLLYNQWFWAITIVFAIRSVSNAQTTVQIGTGTSAPGASLYGPVYRFSAASATTGAQSLMLFTATEMATAGIFSGDYITAVAFNKLSTFNFLIPATYTLRMGNSSSSTPLGTTTIATAWPNVLLNHTIVYTDPAFNIPNVVGWVTINLSAPFQYTGGALEIATDQVMTAGATGASGNFSWQYTIGFDTYLIGIATGGGSNLSQYKQRPNIQITYTSTLGVDILSLSARKSAGNIIVSWDVADEKNMAIYEVERSVNGKDFEKAGHIKAGEDSKSRSYNFTDNKITTNTSGSTLYYRLKCIEVSGAIKYSKTAIVKLMEDTFTSLEAFPSPVTDMLTLRVSGNLGANAGITITNATGKLVRKMAMPGAELKIDMSGLAGGLYLVTYTDSNEAHTLKVNKL